jgi:Tfp pilus assembly protein PilW
MQSKQSERGATLIEQMVALLLGAVMITSLYSFCRAELFHLLTQEAKISSLEDARGSMDMISRDLRLAGSWGTGVVPNEIGSADDPMADPDTVCNRVYAANSRLIHIQMDLNGNGNCADTDPRENIRYELTTAATATCPGAAIIRRNGDCFVANVVLGPSGRLFTYYDENGVELGDSPLLASIKRIQIEFTVASRNPKPGSLDQIGSTLLTSVELRN